MISSTDPRSIVADSTAIPAELGLQASIGVGGGGQLQLPGTATTSAAGRNNMGAPAPQLSSLNANYVYAASGLPPQAQQQQQQQQHMGLPFYNPTGSVPPRPQQQPGPQSPSSAGGAAPSYFLMSSGDMQLPPQQLSDTTPWTLGSTDGTYAMNLVLVQAQQKQQIEKTGGGNQPNVGSTSKIDSVSSTGILKGACGGGHGKSDDPIEGDFDVKLVALQNKRSLYQDRLLKQQPSTVETMLAAACEVMSFDIAEVWLRTGAKTHQLTNSHLRPTALDESTRIDLVDVYYGEKSSERTHRLSPALCKRAKEANDVVWVTAHTKHGAEALRCSISNVRTAVAVPVCHEASNTNITIIFFSIRRVVVKPASVEFLVHMALAAGISSVNSLNEVGHLDREPGIQKSTSRRGGKSGPDISRIDKQSENIPSAMSKSEHVPAAYDKPSIAIRHQRSDRASVTGAPLDLQWRQLQNVEYLTDGGNSWIHTAVFQGRPVVVKTLKPECQDVAVAINEIEGELDIHSRLDHPNIVKLLGAGLTSKNVRFVVLERLDGGTLTQMLGYDTRIRDRRRRFWKRKMFAFVDVLRIARSIAEAMMYLHEEAIPGCIVLHRDLKPDNIGFTLDGTVKVLDFGLAKIIENASISTNDVYVMSGETGSLRYMAPEVAEGAPYNSAADVYSFGIILWELNSGKKPFDGLNRESFYEQVVHGGERPPIKSKWPEALSSLMTSSWDEDMWNRPTFRSIVSRLDEMLDKEKGGTGKVGTPKKPLVQRLTGMVDRHSTWF